MIRVIDEEAKITAAGGVYAGLSREEARKRVVEDLEKLGLLDSVQEYTLSLGKCSRCKTPIEPLVSKQWFVRTKPLAEKAITAVDEKRIEIIPEKLGQDLERMDAQHSGLVHFSSTLVGAPYSGLVLRRLRRNDCFARRTLRLRKM